jgi:hypothetical protein
MNPADRHYPFFDPLWRRVVVVAVVAVWLGFEIIFTREPMWMMIAGGMLAYALWAFILNWPKKPTG